MKSKILNSVKLFSFILLSIIYLEILFKVRVLTIDFDMNLFRAILFSLSYSILVMFFLSFFKEKTVRRIVFALTVIITFLYINQEIYNSFVEGFYSITVAGDFTMGLSFLNDYLYAFRFWHIFYIFPIVSLYLLNRYHLITFNVEYSTLKQPLIVLMLGFLTFFGSLQTINETVESTENIITYSDMDLYTYMYNSQDALKKFGLLTYTQRDFFSLFRENPLSESEYDVLLDDFFENRDPHYYNAYSRIFVDNNFILIMAESLDTFAINEELTPNLYNLKTNYAYFENFYSPLYYRSTADSEFLVQTSFYPDKNVTLSMSAYAENTFKYTLPKMFSDKGYVTYSFHNYTDYFYPRTDFHTHALGYDYYMGSEELGMLDNPEPGKIIFNHAWQSDLELMEKSLDCHTYSEFENCVNILDGEDKFFLNYVTVSGHFKYAADHEIAKLNEDLVTQYEIDNGIELDEEIFYYLAANIELDKALGYLFSELDRTGHLDDTVIMIFGDHYAYGIDKETIWEYDDMKDDGSDMDIHNVPMLVYSNSFLLNGVIDNYMSTIDVMPTLSNLFGLRFDYTKVFGVDVLGTSENYVRFADMSFVSEYYSYQSLSEEYIIIDEHVTPEYLAAMNHRIINDYKYNLLVLQYDYFKKEDEEE
ncbi:MAG: sulfatase-like hydrolase/transferase [Candidatus Izimaplasma sp.]|nr:sulfatase-like hydrolase/transferase [Candidatus Izimaplasma bacterium]